jgi:pimeloyl-ACP methyl ester carboxylesterase
MSGDITMAPVAPVPLPTAGWPQPDRESSFLGLSRKGFHRVAYVEWGDPNADRTAICVHGLSRQGRDFDRVAATLAGLGWRVICPDLVGRGRSGRLADAAEYAIPQYAADLNALIARLGVERVDWIGTSLGGLIGMVLAGQAESPIDRLVVNDIGPFLPWQALHRLGSTLREMPKGFADYDAALTHFRSTLAPFGDLAPDEWDHLVRYSVAEEPDGHWRKLVDPGISAAFRPVFFYNLSLWNYWDAISCPTLVLRGETSDLLLESTARDMTRRGPRAAVVNIPGCGHAPALLDPAQIAVITDWLEATPVPGD